MTDFYSTLGLPRQATQSEIRSAYRQLARRYHPDLNPSDTAAAQRFIEVNEAHATLSNSTKRKRYDDLLRGGALERRPDEAFRPWTAQEIDERLFHQGSRVFQMGSFGDILADLSETAQARG